MKKALDFPEVRRICAGHQIEVVDIKSVTGSFGKQIFFINQEFLLRASEASMAQEQEKFKRIAALEFAPRIVHTGILQRETGPVYYTLLTLLPGDDFVNVYPEITPAQQAQLGVEVAQFLDHLHAINGLRHDIGLYVPALPAFPGSWREGHQAYWEILRRESEKLTLTPDTTLVFERAFRYLQAAGPALDFQDGPKLLHNDFHPKNILLAQGKFSGVIDWECSQFGEADFELCHLIYWCQYPPQAGIDFRPFLRAFFAAAPRCTQVPDLPRRLSIYQIEHELQQILWNPSAAEAWRVPRIARWIAGDAENLLREVAG